MKVTPKKIGLILLVFALLVAAFFLVPRKRSFQVYLQRAEEAFQKRDFHSSIKLYLIALKYYPKNEKTPQVLLNVGDIYNFSLGNYEKAGMAYDMLAEKFPKSVESRQGFQHAAEMYEKSENYQKAMLSYQGIIDNFPEAGDIDENRFKVAMMALKLKKYEPARRSLMAIIENNPETPIADRVLYQLGNIFFVEGATREAIQVLKVAVEKYPESPLNTEMQFTLANAYEERGMIEDALKIYNKILPDYPNPAVIEKKIEKLSEKKQQRIKMEKKMEATKKALKSSKKSRVPLPSSLTIHDLSREPETTSKKPPSSLNNADGALRP